MLRKFIKIIFVLLLIISVTFWLIYKDHPIILKWIAGSARYIGKPINAVVFTNGQINNTIKVYRVENNYRDNEKSPGYILSLKEFDSEGKLKFIIIDLNEKFKWVGRPAGTSIKDYDTINGRLFQSETGRHFTFFQDDMKGYDFDPNITFTDKEIKFNTPSNILKFDSIRIVLKD